MAENEEVKTSRDKYLSRLKEKYPDREYADDEAIFSQINDDYDDYDKYKSEAEEFSGMLASNPKAASLITAWAKGEDPVTFMIERFGDDFKAALEDEDKVEAIAEANKKYAERIAQEKKFEDEYQKNIAATSGILDELQAEGYSDDEIDNAMQWLIEIMKDAILGKFSKESILMALKAINHDKDVELADRAGEVRGKNAKIEEKMKKRSSGDGTAELSGKNRGGTGVPIPDFGAIGDNFGTKNIWERGGEKRRKYE